MKFKIIDQAIISYSFQLSSFKNNDTNEEVTNEGKIIIGVSIPDELSKEENISLITDLELTSPECKLELKMAFHIEKGSIKLNYLKEKEKELLMSFFPYIITTAKNLLSFSNIPVSGMPYLPLDLTQI
ncbi:TPA: hypothetical protein SIC75_002079 [Pasteurella multocida]|uniref:Preprotein translocase subunit SecB n=1 Tax=Pasteurella multocida TaxID=747 RepID=A0AAW8VB53_PASMD|nr:hypothetical protein [Pasteurella multocida]ANJ89305.1 hypothetical protein PMCN01_0056 [Pasteurella multocida subsp. multocida HB01]ANJ90556.1 hypothetical protein PMCN01_1334 [Pasteurella multocida subsp. multocida HB01]AON58471.1 hypothetical protein AZI96_06930 [Pasteurella multocida]AON59311.1 hypothetical protein AZI96_11475 [Pasteurella multocida]AUK27471.1 hypothetical protein A4205_01835 [Pasteurella multocida]